MTITGVSLKQASKVAFGGVKATTFTANSDTQVTATVPTGAKTGKIRITTPGGTATSPTVFTVPRRVTTRGVSAFHRLPQTSSCTWRTRFGVIILPSSCS